jgi:beta-lactamase class A
MGPRLLCVASAVLCVSACAAPSSTAAATPEPTAAAGEVARDALAAGPLDALVAQVQPDPSNEYGLLIEDLASGHRLAMNQDRVFPSASVYKLALAWEALRQADRGRIQLDKPLEITAEDAVEDEPAGGLGPGDTPTVREALDLMVSVSSNAAAHALLRLVGRDAFNQDMDQVGLPQTRVPAAEDGSEAVTSAEDVARLLRFIALGQGLSSPAQSVLHGALQQAQFPDALRDTLPGDVTILDKTGNLDDASNVGAVLSTPRGTVLMVVLDSGVDPGTARGVIAQLGWGAYEAYLQQ